MDKVSIIIPIYNCEKYLKETIDSCLNQTYQNFELILVDDGSTDKSKSIINSYNDSRIMRIFQNNSGAPKARNNGFEQSTGNLIMFFDADDILNKDALRLMVQAINKDSSDIVICSYSTLKKTKVERMLLEDKCFYPSKDFNTFLLNPFPGNKLYRRSIIDKYNIRFTNLLIGQDVDFYIKYLIFTNKVTTLSYDNMTYRVVENSISHTYTTRILKISDTFKSIEKFAKDNNYVLVDDWYQRLKLGNYFHQYRKIIKIKKYKDRLYSKKVFDKLIKEILNSDSLANQYKPYLIERFKDLKQFGSIVSIPIINSVCLDVLCKGDIDICYQRYMNIVHIYKSYVSKIKKIGKILRR